ncbi:protoheme IX farnesyltransferase [Purpureocillium lavendulum]|uniref:Protoheme IX farnesyltransferase n=1 Tax=Purpureocillium lavendulum TaxID=1247861 RepID=A0AB34FEL3_9HYPO|nr:protoheme IX farnesyltransferase [Purpureocillium lavendulum]
MQVPAARPRSSTAPVPEEDREIDTNGASSSAGPFTADMQQQESDNLQPSGLLNHEALKGKFSLQNVLSPTNCSNHQSSDHSPDTVVDPIQLGLVHLPIAKSLFESFMTVLNPYICQLDPSLHTFDYVRQRSGFLLTAVLATSSKFFNPVLHEKLYHHAQNLFTDCFRHGTKSTEIVQAILTLTYWKTPEDTRAWTSLGYAIRLCFDMGWHKLVPYPLQKQPSITQAERRSLRNIERTCIYSTRSLILRSMSLQTGKPWMIACDGFIDGIESWCDDPLATENDHLLGAFVTLRLATASCFDLLAKELQTVQRTQVQQLISILGRSIDRWEGKWIEKVKSKALADGDECHRFLIRFYGSHLRLQLFSLPLQDMLRTSGSDVSLGLDTVWTAYTNATKVLQLTSNAAFLFKFLLTAPTSVVDAVTSDTVQVIRTAALVFSGQSGHPSSTCELQAQFLNNIAIKLIGQRQEHGELKTPRVGDGGNTPASTRTLAETLQKDYPDQMREPRSAAQQAFDMATCDVSVLQQGRVELMDTNGNMWSEIFASAGFNTLDGTFIP